RTHAGGQDRDDSEHAGRHGPGPHEYDAPEQGRAHAIGAAVPHSSNQEAAVEAALQQPARESAGPSSPQEGKKYVIMGSPSRTLDPPASGRDWANGVRSPGRSGARHHPPTIMAVRQN